MKLVSLPEVVTIVMGQSPPSSTYNFIGDGLPFFQGKADFGEIYPTVRVFCSEPTK
jgi:type I restriction enzyme S subunit